MKNIPVVLVMALALVGCESMNDDGGIPRIRSQRQVDAYNETVSSEGEKLVCTRERPLGSNISRFMCMTLNQRDRIASQAQQDIETIGRGPN
jgi:hypothetical protein